MTCTYGFSHFRHLQNCCNRDGNTIFKYMNYVPIVVATDLEVHFSVLKKGVSQYFCLYSVCTSHWCLVNTFLHIGQLFFWKCKCTFIICYYICFPLCAHILYFDEAIFSIKLFSLVYFTVSVVRQRNEYEIVTETRPIKTRVHNQISLHSAKKIMIIAPSSDEIKYT